MIEIHKQRLKNLENSLEPSITSVKSWAKKNFNIPFWLKIVVYVTIGTGTLAMLRYTYYRIKKVFRLATSPQASEQMAPGHNYSATHMTNMPSFQHNEQYISTAPQKPSRLQQTRQDRLTYETPEPSAPTLPKRDY